MSPPAPELCSRLRFSRGVWIDREVWVSGNPQVFVNLNDGEGAKEIADGFAYGVVTR